MPAYATQPIIGASTAVTTALTSLGAFVPLQIADGQIVSIDIENTGAAAFSDFKIQLQDHPDGEFYDYLLAADFGDPLNSNVPFCKSDPSLLAAGSHTHIHFRINGAYAFKPFAKTGSATTAIVRGNLRGA